MTIRAISKPIQKKKKQREGHSYHLDLLLINLTREFEQSIQAKIDQKMKLKLVTVIEVNFHIKIIN